MRRALGPAMVAILVLLAVGAAPASAAAGHAITIDAPTTFDDIPDEFTAEGIPGCSHGIVENGPVNFAFTRTHGVYAGFKVFTCDNENNGFVLRLNARFGLPGSVGTWAFVDAWGTVAGTHGAGKLTGTEIDNGILDHYFGTVVQ